MSESVQISNFKDVIRLFGSADKMAVELGYAPPKTRHWFTRDKIPSRYWQRVLDAARERGASVTAEDFVRFAAQ